jgi:hypothetical protein
MDKELATQLLERELETLRHQPYADLVGRIGSGSLEYECRGSDGLMYQLEIQFVWDDRAGGNVRVLGSIDDGGWHAWVPVSRSFIKSSDESFVDE